MFVWEKFRCGRNQGTVAAAAREEDQHPSSQVRRELEKICKGPNPQRKYFTIRLFKVINLQQSQLFIFTNVSNVEDQDIAKKKDKI